MATAAPASRAPLDGNPLDPLDARTPEGAPLPGAAAFDARRLTLGLLFQGLARDFEGRLRGTLRARGHLGLQASHQVLFASLARGGTRLTELAQRARMSKQAMGQIVDDLERLGYVARTPDPHDGRAKIVRLTASGRSFLRDAYEVMDDIWQSYARLLGEDALATLQAQLDALLAGTQQAGDAG